MVQTFIRKHLLYQAKEFNVQSLFFLDTWSFYMAFNYGRNNIAEHI